MTNVEKIRTMNNDKFNRFIREIYFANTDGKDFAFCGYNLELWLQTEY